MLASSLVEQPPGQPMRGPVFAFLFVTLCVYVHNVRGHNYITHAVAHVLLSKGGCFYGFILAVAKQGLLGWS